MNLVHQRTCRLISPVAPSRAAALLLLGASLTLASPSRGDAPRRDEVGPPKAASPPEVDLPALIRVGDRARDQGRWVRAEEAYYLAYQLGARGTVGCEWGMALLALRRHVDAAFQLDQCLKDPSIGTAAQRRRYAGSLEKARSEVGQIHLELSHPGGVVTIGGEVWEKDAATAGYVYIVPGTHTIKATLFGFDDAEQTVQVEKGKSVDVLLQFVEKPKETALPARVSNERPKTTKVKVKSSVDRSPPGPFEGMAGMERICGMGVSALGLAGGLIASVLASQYREAAEQRAGVLRPQGGAFVCASPSPENARACGALDDDYDGYEISRNVATGFFIGAGAVGAATLGSFIYYGVERSRRPVHVMPVVAGDQAGVVMEGVW